MKDLIDIITAPALSGNVHMLILLPVVAGLLLFLVPRKAFITKAVITVAVTTVSIVLSIGLISAGNILLSVSSEGPGRYLAFNIDGLSRLILLFISILTAIILVYSLAYNRMKSTPGWFSWFLITLGSSYGAALADNLLLFLLFWGLLAVTIYKLIDHNGNISSAAAKKTLIMIGGSDSIMIIGIAILWKLTGTLNMSAISVHAGNILAVTAFFTLLAGGFTKAGAFPFHTWLPDFASAAPASSTAYMPAALDKLLGIYFMTRLINQMFIPDSWITLLLLSVGVFTIISAVMMALVQHNYKQLLGYHAVSQVGYMIVGLSLGTPLGIAAGLFHMLNNAIYKSGLFMAAGAIEYRTGKDDIDELGGLSRSMPLTFTAALIFALSISGVPPFNGFASKWMIYQAIIEFGTGSDLPQKLWIVWLGLTVLGSALTLASFMKFIGGIFLGKQSKGNSKTHEVSPLMYIPMLLLAAACISGGALATIYVIPEILAPVTGTFSYPGFWDPGIVSLLVLVSLLTGVAVYLMLNIRKFRKAETFIGGETFREKAGFPATEFYKSVNEFGIIDSAYKEASAKLFDIYNIISKFVNYLNKAFSAMHTGVLPLYIIWVFAGIILMLLVIG